MQLVSLCKSLGHPGTSCLTVRSPMFAVGLHDPEAGFAGEQQSLIGIEILLGSGSLRYILLSKVFVLLVIPGVV